MKNALELLPGASDNRRIKVLRSALEAALREVERLKAEIIANEEQK